MLKPAKFRLKAGDAVIVYRNHTILAGLMEQ